MKRRKSQGCEQALDFSDRLASIAFSVWRSFSAASRKKKEGPLRSSKCLRLTSVLISLKIVRNSVSTKKQIP